MALQRTVTETDLATNPILVELGAVIGDTVSVYTIEQVDAVSQASDVVI
jgi:hypothetical protein